MQISLGYQQQHNCCFRRRASKTANNYLFSHCSLLIRVNLAIKLLPKNTHWNDSPLVSRSKPWLRALLKEQLLVCKQDVSIPTERWTSKAAIAISFEHLFRKKGQALRNRPNWSSTFIDNFCPSVRNNTPCYFPFSQLWNGSAKEELHQIIKQQCFIMGKLFCLHQWHKDCLKYFSSARPLPSMGSASFKHHTRNTNHLFHE